MFVEVTQPNNKTFTLGNIYRSNSKHPSLSPKEQYDEFIELLNTTLIDYSSNSKELLIAGDFNLDVLKIKTCSFASTYIDTLFAHGMLQCVTNPTRFNNTSATCIDHFISNCVQKNYEICAILEPISDHFPIVYFKLN